MAAKWRKVTYLDEIPLGGIWSHQPDGEIIRDGYLRIDNENTTLAYEMVGVCLQNGRVMGCNGALDTYLYIGEE